MFCDIREIIHFWCCYTVQKISNFGMITEAKSEIPIIDYCPKTECSEMTFSLQRIQLLELLYGPSYNISGQNSLRSQALNSHPVRSWDWWCSESVSHQDCCCGPAQRHQPQWALLRRGWLREESPETQSTVRERQAEFRAVHKADQTTVEVTSGLEFYIIPKSGHKVHLIVASTVGYMCSLCYRVNACFNLCSQGWWWQ